MQLTDLQAMILKTGVIQMTIIYATIFLTIFYRKLAKHTEFD